MAKDDGEMLRAAHEKAASAEAVQPPVVPQVINLGLIEAKIYWEMLALYRRLERPLSQNESHDIARRHSHSANTAQILNRMCKKGVLLQDESKHHDLDRIPVTDGITVQPAEEQVGLAISHESKTVQRPHAKQSENDGKFLHVLKHLLEQCGGQKKTVKLADVLRTFNLPQHELDALRKRLRQHKVYCQQKRGVQELIPSRLTRLIRETEKRLRGSGRAKVKRTEIKKKQVAQEACEGMPLPAPLNLENAYSQIENKLIAIRQRLTDVRRNIAEAQAEETRLRDNEEQILATIKEARELGQKLANILKS